MLVFGYYIAADSLDRTLSFRAAYDISLTLAVLNETDKSWPLLSRDAAVSMFPLHAPQTSLR